MSRATDPMRDREDQRRPTRQRLEKGDYRLVSGDRAGVSYAQDAKSTPLRSAFEGDKITRRMLDAGERYEKLCRALCGSPGPRSCLDWSPRGADESESEYATRVHIEFRNVCQAMGSECSSIVMDVAYFQNGTGPRRVDYRRWVKLTEGLEMAADYWQLPID